MQYELAGRGRPGDSLVYQAIAEINWHMGQTDAAIFNYERAYAIDAQRSGLYCNAGGAHRLAGDDDEAMKLHDHAIAIRPERVCPYYCLAYLKLTAEGTASALAFLENLPEGIDIDRKPTDRLPVDAHRADRRPL